jgi:hypothetical protein
VRGRWGSNQSPFAQRRDVFTFIRCKKAVDIQTYIHLYSKLVLLVDYFLSLWSVPLWPYSTEVALQGAKS